LFDSWEGYGKAGATLRVSAGIASERIAATSASVCTRMHAQKRFDWTEFERRRDRTFVVVGGELSRLVTIPFNG
jgi:hypothetical protein